MQKPYHREYFKRALRPSLYIAPQLERRQLPCDPSMSTQRSLVPEVLPPPHVPLTFFLL